jgi:hypothetical protein
VHPDAEGTGFTLPAGVKFVPMFFGDGVHGASYGDTPDAGNISAAVSVANGASGTGELLAFNEPDKSGQSNLTPAEAAAIWPSLRATGLRLGAPATADDPSVGGSWYRQFLALISPDIPDFIPIHYYAQSTDDPLIAASNLIARIDACHSAFGLPIWVTEWGMIGPVLPTGPSDATAEAFMRVAIRRMDGLAYVERYAWYRIGPGDADVTGYLNIALNDTDGTRTNIGTTYLSLPAW